MLRKRLTLFAMLRYVRSAAPAIVASAAAIAGMLSPVNLNAAEEIEDRAQSRFQIAAPRLPDGLLPLDEVVAFEEAVQFVYLAGRLSASEEPAASDVRPGGSYIRLVLLRPATLVIEVCPFESRFRRICAPTAMSIWEAPSGANKKAGRAVCVFQGRAEQTAPRIEAKHLDNDICDITITTDDRRFRLSLPLGLGAPGRIAVESAGGETILAKRRLPAGVLPLGPEGMRLVERWDSRYRGSSPPSWDKGFPSSHLKQAIESGVLKPGRAVVLGCGTGTNAIYLVEKGFDVTAIDIAPTALNLAEEKAKKANVNVRWLLADVLAPPADLEPFDVVFDRGCYHGVRGANAVGYVNALKRLSRPGTRILILAGNANEAEHYGPPRVTEGELRNDFSSSFEFLWLKTVRFDSVDPNKQGALAWSVLLRRKADAGY